MDSVLLRAITPDTRMREIAIKSFHLSLEDETESLDLNLRFDTLTAMQKEELHELAETTPNAGLQYLFIGETSLLQPIMENRFLDAKVVSLLLVRLKETEFSVLPFNALQDLLYLLQHPAIVADVLLFKQTWELAMAKIPPYRSSDQRTQIKWVNIYRCLDWQSCEAKGPNAMSVETLLFILAYIARNDGPEFTHHLVEPRDKALEVRSLEIDAWVQDNAPDLVGLPLSWILEVSDLFSH